MTIFMSDYAARLLELDKNGNATKESAEKIMLFNNAMLASEKDFVDSTGNVLSVVYRDVYLEKMYAGNVLLLTEDVEVLASMNPTDGGYNELYSMYQKEKSMLLLWSTEGILVEKLKEHGENEDILSEISDLTFDRGEAKFLFSHFSPSNAGVVDEKVYTYFLSDSYELLEACELEKIEQIKEKQSKILQKHILSLATDVALIAAGTTVPEAAITLSLASMYFQGSVGTVSQLDNMTESRVGKLGIKAGNALVKDSVASCMEFANYNGEMEQENEKIFLEWFGMGGEYRIAGGDGVLNESGISFAGNYDPNVVRQMALWEENGLNWIDWKVKNCNVTADVEVLAETIKTKNYSQAEIEHCEMILNGKGNMFEEMTMDEFLRAVHIIDSESEIENSIHSQFNAAVKEGGIK